MTAENVNSGDMRRQRPVGGGVVVGSTGGGDCGGVRAPASPVADALCVGRESVRGSAMSRFTVTRCRFPTDAPFAGGAEWGIPVRSGRVHHMRSR